jgi:hypothetical protein
VLSTDVTRHDIYRSGTLRYNKDHVDTAENYTVENTENVTRIMWNTRMGTVRTCVSRGVTEYFSAKLISRPTNSNVT